MDVLFLCVIGGLVAAAGLWLASRDTEPAAKNSDEQ